MRDVEQSDQQASATVIGDDPQGALHLGESGCRDPEKTDKRTTIDDISEKRK